MSSARLYLLQRLSAMVMAPLVILHLGVMIVAIQGGLDSAEILSRTRGSLWWGSVYGLGSPATIIGIIVDLLARL